MIKFTLKCAGGHEFESWFQSAQAFEKLQGAGLVSCAVCGGGGVEKALMAPRVQAGHRAAPTGPDAAPPEKPAGHADTPLAPTEPERRIAALRRKIEATADYVGADFPRRARAIHEGTAPDRPIYGEARADEARRLIEDGIPVTPLPFTPGRKSN